MARFALHPKKTVLEATTFEEVFEFLDDVSGQLFALAFKVLLESRPMLFDDPVKEGLFRPMPLVADPGGRQVVEIFL